MGSGIYVAASGAVAQSTALDVTASNVANAGSAGFRAQRVTFATALGRARGKDEAFVQVGKTAEDPTAGAINPTGNPLDLALDGDGYFAIDTPRGVRYTRAGNFHLDAAGTLVNADGLAARAKGGGSLVLPPDAGEITVTGDGVVSAGGKQIGALEIARFAGGLNREGRSLYAASAAPLDLAKAPAPNVVSGALEGSNYDVVRGVIDMVRIQRGYESLHRMIETYKQIDDQTARELGTKS
jgi:flagellar basal body rod protein FlgG